MKDHRPAVIPRRLAIVALVACAALPSLGCRKPEPPRVTPKEARIVAVSAAGMDVLMKVEAFNPNASTLSARSVTATARLDGRWEMGSITIAKPVVLPPNAATTLDVPVMLPWKDIGALSALATTPRPVPYAIEGTVQISGERLNIDVPFAVTGTITREQLAGAALKGLPPIPGVPTP
jgi:LEA14-like dessication related protein